jgi:uncharacterized protein (DUF488 family)
VQPSDITSSRPSGRLELWTIGHSTRPVEALIGLLRTHGVRVLADVRTTPYSRYNPQFHQDALTASLQRAGIDYRHMPGLGGRRKSRRDSENLGWRNTSFRGYADYMQTPPFRNALEELMALAQRLPVAIMCAEAVPWRCHRNLIADALVCQGGTVRHIISDTALQTHTLTSFATYKYGRLMYPAGKTPDSNLSPF